MAHRDRDPKNAPPDLSGKKILIVRLSALGDVIRTLPAVLALMQRFPEASFTWLVESPSVALLRTIPGLQLIEVDRKQLKRGSLWSKLRLITETVAHLRKQHFELSIDFHGVLKSAIYPFFAGIPMRVGFSVGGSKEGASTLLTHRLSLNDWNISRYARNQALARYFEPELVLPQWRPLFSEADRASFAEAMASRPLLLFPGTSAHGRNKRWPAKSWAALYQRLAPDFPCLFVFGPEDQHYREALQTLLQREPPALPSMPLHLLAGALAQAACLISCDTGPMHLASILGVPVVALMGPSDPILNRPLPGASRIILPDVPCAPCRNRSCSTLICQDFTTPKRVEAQVRSLLSAHRTTR